MEIKYDKISVDISLVLSVLLLDSHKWIMLNICQLLNLTTQLDNSSLVTITKQRLILFSLWCKNVTLAKHGQANVFEWILVPNIYKF